MYGLMISAREFSSDGPDEDIATQSGEQSPGRNSSKQKHDEKMIYRPRGLRGLCRRKLYIKAKSQEETGTKTSSEVFSHQGGAARGGPTPPVCEEHPDSFSCLFSSRDFSYLVKTAKIIKEEFFANLF
jgi:hypothetical protein